MPQWFGLEARFSQAAPHAVRPCAHVAEQADNEQKRPFVQTVPHAPQFWGSDWRLLQTPLQSRCPAGQDSLSASGEVVEHALVPTKLATSRLAKITREDAKRVMVFPVELESLAQARATVTHFLLFSPTPRAGASLRRLSKTTDRLSSSCASSNVPRFFKQTEVEHLALSLAKDLALEATAKRRHAAEAQPSSGDELRCVSRGAACSTELTFEERYGLSAQLSPLERFDHLVTVAGAHQNHRIVIEVILVHHVGPLL